MSKLAIYAIIALILTGALGGFVWHYRHISAEAAKVPLLEEQIKSANARASDAAEQLAINNARHDDFDIFLSDFQEKADGVFARLRNMPRPAVATIAACAPSLADRRVRNDAIFELLRPGQFGGATPLPEGAGPPN